MAQQVAENLVVYKGGADSLMAQVKRQLVYPPAAAKAGLEGIVVVEFGVDANGKLVGNKVVKSVSPELDAEALRVLGTLRQWQAPPAEMKDVKWRIPVFFTLSEGKTKKELKRDTRQ